MRTFIISGALLFNCVGIVIPLTPCILEQNQYNEYPWVIKLYWGRTWGHGSLTAPNRVLSAYGPFLIRPTVIKVLEFIAAQRGPKGKVICTAKRKAKALYKQDHVERPVFGFWELYESFHVGYNHPFLFTSEKEMSKGVIMKNLMETSKTETCLVPLFQDELGRRTDISFVEVKLTDIDECQRKFPNATEIAKDDFCVVQPYRPSVDPSWLQGAVILCRNKPLGIIKRTGTDPPEAQGLTVFASLEPVASFLRGQTNLWPKSPENTEKVTETRATTTVTTMTSYKFIKTRPIIVTTTTTTTPPVTAEEGTEESKPSSATATDEIATEETGGERAVGETANGRVSSRIPVALVKTRPPPSTKFTGMFVGTPPLRARVATRRSSTPPRVGNQPLIGFTAGAIVFERSLLKYILYA